MWPVTILRDQHRDERCAANEPAECTDAEDASDALQLWPGHVSSLFSEDDLCAGLDQRSDFQRIPVGEPDAPVRLRTADRGGFRRAVQTVVVFRQSDPDQA